MTFLLVDLRGQKHEVEVTVKMGLEAKNYETVRFVLNIARNSNEAKLNN